MRDIPVGNGSLHVNFDDKYQIRDVFFPHVGQENHTEGAEWKFGIWVDGTFSWVSSDGWERRLAYLEESLVTDVTLENSELEIAIDCNDTVASHNNIFLRRIRVRDLASRPREVRLFLHQDLRIYENKVGDTAYFDPITKGIVHYQKDRYFLINTDPAFDSFATGRKQFQGKEGTWRDAEDGELHGGAITEGSVDSTVGIHLHLGPMEETEFFYWIAAGTDLAEVARLDSHVRGRGPEKYLDYTENYWRVWVNKNETDLTPLSEEMIRLVKRSLLIIRTQIDNDGAILAANDWDVTLRATDHYSYLWPRDGAFVAHALDLSGHSHLTRKFFDLCGRIVHPDGYFLQKYNADGTVASGWHAAWDPTRGESMVPIQEDETALVLWALWEHYDRFRDIEFAHRLYKQITVPCAEFMSGFIHPALGLPQPTWNLWEDRRGIHTFTCAAVVAGLTAAANFAELFAEGSRAERYRVTAKTISESMVKHLYSDELGRFYRSLEVRGDGLEPDPTVDASLFALFFLGCFLPDDRRVAATMSAVEEKLGANGGIARFENDGYMRVSGQFTGNPWFICTLWVAEYHTARATNLMDLERSRELLEWAVRHALPSGTMAEQVDPDSGEPVSVAPLTWSHSTFISAALNYLRKLRQLS
ncbi:MAG TPA: glycoside hydrolase family 15 protein [Pyrinomonadaceae bacterium]|nr:glycoside hydrolase family 15 protein [Pyrinomonadaceae bacterium]HMP65069.1 glycoside hydrolase family 15 protein [Pyrinomonadaceae bacterium]